MWFIVIVENNVSTNVFDCRNRCQNDILRDHWRLVREWFDPTGHGGFGKPTRRQAAQAILNGTAAITPQALYETINAKFVFADTIFQAIISVEKGLWNISIPSTAA